MGWFDKRSNKKEDETIGHIAVQRWFAKGAGWTHSSWFAEENQRIMDLSRAMDPLIKAEERGADKLHYATNGKSHYYGIVYHDPHCEDEKALGRGGGRNYVMVRFTQKLPEGMEEELKHTLENLAVPKTKRGSVGEYHIKMEGGRFTATLPEGIELIRTPREAPYHPADEAQRTGSELMQDGDRKADDLRR